MDFLKETIAQKRKQLDSLNSEAGPSKKYFKKSELEKLKKTESTTSSSEPKSKSPTPSLIPSKTTTSESSNSKNDQQQQPVEVFNISNEEAVRRLRAKGQPIRLFAETDKERRLRLRALELMEERDKEVGDAESGRNDLMRAMVGLTKEQEEKKAVRKNIQTTNAVGSKTATDEEEEGTTAEGEKLVDLSLIKKDPYKLYPQVYKVLKRVLKEWEQSMDERPDDIKQSAQGQKAAAIQKQSADYLKPLFKQLRSRDLAPDVLGSIAEIAHNLQLREYLKANDAYLRLSIGNAPWPIGVTMVGIHERSAREKIFSNQVAHVLNDEVSRKYIQSLKRLLTFAQSKYPPKDLSQRMG